MKLDPLSFKKLADLQPKEIALELAAIVESKLGIEEVL